MKAFLFTLGTALGTLQAREPSRTLQRHVVAAVIWAEARSEGYDAMRAVAEVIRNRAKRDNLTPYQVVTAPKQFTCLNGVSAFRLAERAMSAEGQDALYFTFADSLADTLTDKTLGYRFQDNRTKGATHYHDDSITPDWAAGETVTCQIGRLLFYRIEE